MTTKQPDALRLAEMLTADEWPGSVTLVSYARECVAELLRQHAENETLRAGYAAARLEIESLKAQLHAAKQINAAQFGLLAASIPGSAMRASRGQAPAQTARADSVQEDVARLDWLEQNLFHREMDEWDIKFGGRGDQNMWVLFAPKGVQGSARRIIDAARKQGEKQ